MKDALITLMLLFIPAMAPSTLPLSPRSTASSDLTIAQILADAQQPLRPMTPEEIEQRLIHLDDLDRVELIAYGQSYEGYPLRAALIARADRLSNLDSLRSALHAFAFPTAKDSGSRALDEHPIVIWIGAAVHGNEASGAEAALALVEHLALSDYEDVRHILDQSIVIIDPLQNPDGRRRFLAELNQWNGLQENTDRQSLAHRSGWPSGRGNHYFMDLNRDWANLSQAETWGKVRLMIDYPPQVTFDLHEMGGQEGYLFSPPRSPFNPNIPKSVHSWWATISRDMAAAFGREGWTCTTRDWHEEFHPNRGAAWPLHMGAISFLGEQFNTQGASLLLPTGGRIGLREAIHHQYTAALSLIESAVDHRLDILEDYRNVRRAAYDKKKGDPDAYLISMEGSVEQALRLAERLSWMGIDILEVAKPFKQEASLNYWGERRDARPFPAGSLLVPLSQAQGTLAKAILEFKPSMDESFLRMERESLESGKGSLLYETTAWSLAMSHGCEVYALDAMPDVRSDPFVPKMLSEGRVLHANASYSFLLSADQPGATKALARLHEKGIPCWGAGEAFSIAGLTFPAGSIVVKREDYDGDLNEALEAVSNSSGAVFHGVNQPLSDLGPDLGASSFQRLAAPRVALIAGSPFYQTTFGSIWHLFDQELGYPVSLLSLGQLSSAELDRYNVIILGDADSGSGEVLPGIIGEQGMVILLSWMDRGGTLITLGESSAILSVGENIRSSLRSRRQILDDPDPYLNTGRPDSFSLQAINPRLDEWLRRFSPQGCILRANLDAGHWISAGLGDRVPVMVNTDRVLLGTQKGEILGRFAEAESLHLSGLLWPEAAERLASSCYLYRESFGRGQHIAFLGNPVYRAGFHGSARLLLNAVLLGPGMGARQPLPW